MAQLLSISRTSGVPVYGRAGEFIGRLQDAALTTLSDEKAARCLRVTLGVASKGIDRQPHT